MAISPELSWTSELRLAEVLELALEWIRGKKKGSHLEWASLVLMEQG